MCRSTYLVVILWLRRACVRVCQQLSESVSNPTRSRNQPSARYMPPHTPLLTEIDPHDKTLNLWTIKITSMDVCVLRSINERRSRGNTSDGSSVNKRHVSFRRRSIRLSYTGSCGEPGASPREPTRHEARSQTRAYETSSETFAEREVSFLSVYPHAPSVRVSAWVSRSPFPFSKATVRISAVRSTDQTNGNGRGSKSAALFVKGPRKPSPRRARRIDDRVKLLWVRHICLLSPPQRILD